MGARVAIVGSGGAGLAAAYELRHDAAVTVFEREGRLGGHVNTITVQGNSGDVGVDTGFSVFDRLTYPQLTAFFEDLGLETVDHRGGLNFFDLDSGLQYGSAELRRRHSADVVSSYGEELVSVWNEARRFRRHGLRDHRDGLTDVPLGRYLDEHGYSEEFKYSYVVLLASAAWAVPAELIWEMPASAVIAFFMTHDLAGLGSDEPEWQTVAGDSDTYVRRVMEEIGEDVRVGSEVRAVRELPDGVEVVTSDGAERFDFCVMATHADEALRLVENPSDLAADVLSLVRYHPTVVVLHTDASVLPSDRDRWECWNYGRVVHDDRVRPYFVWWLNRIHAFEAAHDYFVTLNCPLPIREDAIIREIPYTHPILTVEVREAQSRIHGLNEGGRIKYSGSYVHSKELGPDSTGYHEAAFVSGREAGSSILRELSALHFARA
jgi:uncharacterized protein